MEETNSTLPALVDVYLKIRNAIEEMEDRHKEELKELKEQFEVVGGNILEICNAQNADSIKTPVGTVTRRVSSRYWTSDWSSMYKFIQDNDAFFLMEQRIHNSNMRDFLEENPGKFPMGLQNDRKFVISVRKPTAK